VRLKVDIYTYVAKRSFSNGISKLGRSVDN